MSSSPTVLCGMPGLGPVLQTLKEVRGGGGGEGGDVSHQAEPRAVLTSRSVPLTSNARSIVSAEGTLAVLGSQPLPSEPQEPGPREGQGGVEMGSGDGPGDLSPQSLSSGA